MTARAREITFPPISGYQQNPLSSFSPDAEGKIDITTGTNFLGLTTFAHLPYVHCLAPEDEEIEKYDIAILGAGFDTVSIQSLVS